MTKAHSKFEGLSNCTKCHVLGKQVSENKCLDCHTEIKLLRSENNGYHSSPEVKGKKCWSCHSEHYGRDYKIINFNPDKFDHSKSGFVLKGRHSGIKCEKCHRTKFITNKLFKKRKGTYLGLSTDCVSCHEDVHQNTLGNNCASCHNTVKFKPADFFNHDTTKFRLTGAHSKTACVKCHVKETMNGKPFQKFAGLSFGSCASCHKDVHHGKLGRDCGSCHNTRSFKQLNRNSFNHNKTKFPLRGAHRKVSCANCHGKNPLSKPKFAECTDCHKDAHFGEFTVKGVLKDCKGCHSVDSFNITLFTTEEHNKSDFRLTGAHLAVPCQSCHYKKVKNKDQWHFKNIGMKCVDCHKNIHGSEISGKFMPDEKCNTCHVTETWNNVSFNHDLTEFKLTGKHKSADCRQCHGLKNGNGKVIFKFASIKSSCTACHKDIHFGQFDAGVKNAGKVCENCHGYNNWKPVKFDHEKSSFPLKGAHEKVPCSGCHKIKEINGKEFINYKMDNFKCASCHS